MAAVVAASGDMALVSLASCDVFWLAACVGPNGFCGGDVADGFWQLCWGGLGWVLLLLLLMVIIPERSPCMYVGERGGAQQQGHVRLGSWSGQW